MAKPFETAGLKTLLLKDPPTKEEDPDFSPEDIVFGNTLCSQYDA
jgi:hypothetical protein